MNLPGSNHSVINQWPEDGRVGELPDYDDLSRRVRRHKATPGGATKLTLLVVLDADSEHRRPTLHQLAGEVGVTAETVRTLLRELQALGQRAMRRKFGS